MCVRETLKCIQIDYTFASCGEKSDSSLYPFMLKEKKNNLHWYLHWNCKQHLKLVENHANKSSALTTRMVYPYLHKRTVLFVFKDRSRSTKKKNTYVIVFLNHAFFTAVIILIKAAYVYSPTFNYWQSRRSRFIRIYVLYIRHCARAVACHVHILRVLITRIISIRRRPFAQPLPRPMTRTRESRSDYALFLPPFLSFSPLAGRYFYFSMLFRFIFQMRFTENYFNSFV